MVITITLNLSHGHIMGLTFARCFNYHSPHCSVTFLSIASIKQLHVLKWHTTLSSIVQEVSQLLTKAPLLCHA